MRLRNDITYEDDLYVHVPMLLSRTDTCIRKWMRAHVIPVLVLFVYIW